MRVQKLANGCSYCGAVRTHKIVCSSEDFYIVEIEGGLVSFTNAHSPRCPEFSQLAIIMSLKDLGDAKFGRNNYAMEERLQSPHYHWRLHGTQEEIDTGEGEKDS